MEETCRPTFENPHRTPTTCPGPEGVQPTILDKARQLVYHERQDEYGHPAESLGTIGEIWSALLGIDIDAETVALMMAGLKLARLSHHREHEDSQVDLCGYVAALERIQKETE